MGKKGWEKRTRRFDGKVYDFAILHTTKKVAEGSKKSFKRDGFLVRIVKLKGGYGIYIRDKR